LLDVLEKLWARMGMEGKWRRAREGVERKDSMRDMIGAHDEARSLGEARRRARVIIEELPGNKFPGR
jgi:hypothetical protein